MTANRTSRRPTGVMRISMLLEAMQEKLEDPSAALDALVSGLAKGEHHLEVWAQLHEVVVRDETTSDLAMAYEKIAKEKRIKLLAPGDRALLFLHAAQFFGDALGDSEGAIGYARQVLEAVPGHPEGFASLERLLAAKHDRVGLAKLYVEAAGSGVEPQRQIELLKQAAEQVEGDVGAASVAVDVYQRLLRLQPGDEAALDALVGLLMGSGKQREAVKALEDTLRRAEQVEGADTMGLRSRLLELYTTELGEPQKAIPHVEALLVLQADHERALAVAESLLEHRAVAPRAAAALSDAYEKVGRLKPAADMLTMELKLVRGPRRVEVQRRLAILRQDVLGDTAGALELLGPAVAGDPSNDDLRRRFVELSVSLDQPREAARLLERALRAARDGAVRARVGVEIGGLYRKLGDVQRAEQALKKVIATGTDEQAALGAARHLAEMYADSGDQAQLASALELVVRHEPEAEPRHNAARKLTRLCDDGVADAALAIPAWQALVDSPWADEALRRLEPLYEKASNHAALADVLECRAGRAKDAGEARELAFRAAEMRSTVVRDRGAALGAWRGLVEKYGPSREAHARLLPLLEQEKQWEEAAQVLGQEIELAEPDERPKLLARLAQLKQTRLGDAAGALASFRAALQADPQENTSRVAVEKLLGDGQMRLEAADILEPLYRKEEAATGLIRVLETRGELASSVDQRLSALAEAAELAEGAAQDPDQAVRLAGRALGESVRSHRAAVPLWLGRVQEIAAAGVDPGTRAEVLADALGDQEVDSEDLLALARGAGEALVLSGNVEQAIEVYRRALAYAPSSSELLSRIDELLAQQGSPHERLALYQSALEQPCEPPRRRELLHAMGALQRRELGDLAGAVQTWAVALGDDPKDQTAHQALVDAYTEQQSWGPLYAELQRALEYHTGERRMGTVRRMAEVKGFQGEPAEALRHYRELLAAARQPDEVLGAIEQLAVAEGDPETIRDVLEQRISSATEPDEQAELLERLGRVQALELGDAEAAARSWREGARLSESSAANDERALRLYERVLHVSPADREAAQRLIELYARAEMWNQIPDAFEVVLQAAEDDREPVRQLLGLEEHALAAGGVEVFVKLVDAALGLSKLDADRGRQLKLAKARALGTGAGMHDAAAGIYRSLLGEEGSEQQSVAEAFDAFLEGTELSPERVADRRWLLGWRAEHAKDAIAVLMRWATAEEETFANPPGALELYERVVKEDPDRTDAMSDVARLRAQLGDPEGALEALTSLREHTEEQERAAIDLKVATLLLEQLEKPSEALAVAESLLEAHPTDPGALGIVNRALAHPDTKARAAELLERASDAAEDAEQRAQVLETLLAMSTDAPELVEARRRWFGRLLDASGEDAEAALGIALRGAQEYSDEEELWDAAERFARRLDQPGPVAEAYARALEQDLSADAAEALGRRMVEFHEEWFEEPDRVIGLLLRVIALCPSAGWAFDRLKLAYNAAGRWEELFDLYDQTLERADDEKERADLLREAAMAAKDFAADPDRAISYLEQYNVVSPGDPRIESSLERLYEREGRTRPLIALLSGQLEQAEDDDRLDLQARVASLWLDIDSPSAALTLLEAGLADDPDAVDAIDLLERVLKLPSAREARPEGEDADEAGPSVRDRAADHLRTYYERNADTEDVARVMEVRLESVTDPAERVTRLADIVKLRLEQLDDPAGAFENVASLVRLEPTAAEHRSLLGELARQVDAQARRAELLTSVATEAADDLLRAGLEREAASIYQEELGEPERAIELYLEVLDLAVEDRALALVAARELDSLLEEAGRGAERCTVLERRAELETDAAARRVALGNAAQVAADTLGDLERGIRAWRQRLEDVASDMEALDGLCVTLERAEKFDELIVSLGARAALQQDRDSARADLVRIARIQAERLENRPAAIDAWHAVRAHSGGDLESFDALVSLLSDEERWSDLGTLLEEEARETEDAERRMELYRQLGDLHRQRTDQPALALRAFVSAGDWEQAREVAASEGLATEVAIEVRQDLLSLATEAWQTGGDDQRPASAAEWAVDAVADKLREVGQHEEVVQLLLRGARLDFSPERRRELRRMAACSCSDQLQDGARAVDIFRELFTEDPSDQVAAGSVTRFALLLEEAEEFAELVALWEQQAKLRAESGDAASAAALWGRAAELCEGKLQNEDRAIEDYRQGAGLGGEAALEALARIYEARGDQQRTAEVLEWLCGQSSRDALGPRALRLAEVYVAGGRSDLARARLERAAGTALEAGPVRRRLGELYRAAQDWDNLAELTATEAGRAPDAKSRLALLREAASLHRTEREDPNAAVPLLEQAVELEPDDAALRLELSAALTAAERFDEAAAILQQQIERYGSRRPKDRALVHFQLARVLMAAGRRDEALTELTAANKIDPAHPGILQTLARLAVEQGEYQRAERMLRALLLVIKPGEGDGAASRAEALLDLSEIAVVQEDPIRATEFVESAFEAALESDHEATALEAALRARGRTELLARALETRLEKARDPRDAARALADLVMMYAEQRGADQEPPPEYRKRARSIQRKLESQKTSDDAAWQALGEVYDHLGDAAAEAAILERRVQNWVQRDDVPPNADPFYRLAEVRLAEAATRAEGLDLLERAYSIQPDPARAERLLGATLEDDAGSERALSMLEQIARRPGGEQALAEVLSRIIRLPGDRTEAVREGVALAKQLDDAELLRRMLEGAVDCDLSDDDGVWVRCELADVREAGGDVGGALDLREQAATLAGPEEARELRLQVARAAAAEDADLPRAARVYQALLSDDAADQQVWEPLLDVYRQLGERARLVQLIDQTVTLVDSVSGRCRLRLEQANILLDQDEVEQATQILQEILEEDPAQANAGLLLSGILEKAGRNDELAALLTTQLDGAKDRQDLEAIVSISERLVSILEREGRLDDAIDVAYAVLDWDAASESARRTIVRLAERTGDAYRVGDALEGLLGVLQGAEAAELATRLITVRKEQADAEGVERAVELGFKACPENTGLRDGLIALRGKRENWAGVAEVLERAVELTPGDEDLVQQLIGAYRSAGDPARALEVLSGVVERDPQNPVLYRERAALLGEMDRDEEALADLEYAHTQSGEYGAELVEALEKAIARADDSAEERALTLRLIAILRGSGDVDGVRARLRYLVESDPNDRDALRCLAEVETGAESWDAASAAYVQLMPLVEGDELVAMAGHLAQTCELAGRPEDARAGMERALEVAPNDVELRARLCALYESMGEHRELARLLQQQAAAEGDVEVVVQYLLRAGELLLMPDGDVDEAVRVLEGVRSMAPENLHCVVLLARAYGAHGGGQDAMSLLQATVAEYQGRRIKEMAWVYQEISRMQYEEGFLTDAMESLSKAFEMDLRNAALGMQLGELALDTEEWEGASRAFRQVSMMKPYDAEKDEGALVEQKADAQYYLGWLAYRAGDQRKAKILVSKALAAVPDHEQARSLLEQLGGK